MASSLFGIGANKATSKSQSTSSSLGLGYGYSGSDSASSSRGVSGGQSTQSVAFADMFASMFGNAGGAAARAAGAAPSLTGTANTLFNSGGQFLEQLGGGAGADYLERRLGADNPVLDEQIGALGSDVGRFLREQVNPGITDAGVATGTLGGGRQGVAQGLASRAATEEFARGATALRAGDVAARDAAAGSLMSNRTNAAGAGLGALPGLFGLAQGGNMAELSPYLALAQIMGGPTVLGQSSQFSSDVSDSLSRAYGEDFSYDSSQSQSTSNAKNIGISGGFGATP